MIKATGLVLALGAVAALAAADKPIEIQEFPVPWKDTRPRDPDYAGPEAVWFVGQTGHYLAKLNPKTREFTRIDLEDEPGPHNLIVGDDGVIWYAGNLKGYIGRVDPKTQQIRRIAMPDAAATDPHTLTFDEGQKNIWFTVQGGNFIGRLNIASEKVDLIRVPTEHARPYGIVVARDGRPWIVLFGTNKLASVDPKTLKLTEHVLPHKDSRPRRLGLTSDGRVWYGDYARGYLGAFDPTNGAIQEWPLPNGKDSLPYAVAVDSRDRVWAVETGVQPNRFVAFDPKTGQFVSSTPVPSGGGTIRHVDYDPKAGRIWFGTDVNTIGYAQVMP
jgi:virginiamycin B lyase